MSDPELQPIRKPPRWNLLSLSIPVVGFCAGVAVGSCGGNGFLWDGHPVDGIFWGFRVWFGSAILGFLAAVIALVRVERWIGIAIAGVLINLVILGIAWQFIFGR